MGMAFDKARHQHLVSKILIQSEWPPAFRILGAAGTYDTAVTNSNMGGMRARCIHCDDVAGNKYGGVRHRRFQSSKIPDDAGSNLTLDQAQHRTKHRLQTKKGRFISASGC